MTAESVLNIENLHTYFFSGQRQAFIRSVDGVCLKLFKGETLGLVGESGSGKSVTALSIMGLVDSAPGVIRGNITLNTGGQPKDLLQHLDRYVKTAATAGRVMAVHKNNQGWRRQVDRNMRDIRGRKIAMIFQNPKRALNPFITIGRQIRESILLNTAVKCRRAAREKTLEWLERVKIDSPRLRYDNNPYGLSGGMCQRAMIAMALSAEPCVLIADEPTTGLDATIQSKIVELLAEIKMTVGVTTLLISHDIDVIRSLADRVAVMYSGTILEHGPAEGILGAKGSEKHPYTDALLASIPSPRQIREKSYLRAIRGEVPDTAMPPRGCRFFPRCEHVNGTIEEICREQAPEPKEIKNGHWISCWRHQI